MMWVVALALVALLAAGLIWLGKLPRRGWELTGAALMAGIAGYALQGAPAQPGAPKPPAQVRNFEAEALTAQRQAMAQGRFGDAQSWLIVADSLTRRGEFASAATVLRRAVADNPQDADLWVALGNALIGHGDGVITPAAQFALQRAADIAPQHPGPPFFMGLSLAQSGRLEEARTLWRELLARSPEEAPWRPDLEMRLARLDAMLGSAVPPGAAAPADGGTATP